MSAYLPSPETQTVGERKKREVLSLLSYWRFVIFGIRNMIEIRRDCVGYPVFGVFRIKAESQNRRKRQLMPKSRERGTPLTAAFREKSAAAQDRASWASGPDLRKLHIGAGFRDQVRKPVRVSWAPVGLLTFVDIAAEFRHQARSPAQASWGLGRLLRDAKSPAARRAREDFSEVTTRAKIRSDRERTRQPVERARGRAIEFALCLSGSRLALWGGARWNAYERRAATRRDFGPRGRR